MTMDHIREKELLSRLSDAIESGKLKELERAREALKKFYDSVVSLRGKIIEREMVK